MPTSRTSFGIQFNYVSLTFAQKVRLLLATPQHVENLSATFNCFHFDSSRLPLRRCLTFHLYLCSDCVFVSLGICFYFQFKACGNQHFKCNIPRLTLIENNIFCGRLLPNILISTQFPRPLLLNLICAYLEASVRISMNAHACHRRPAVCCILQCRLHGPDIASPSSRAGHGHG